MYVRVRLAAAIVSARPAKASTCPKLPVARHACVRPTTSRKLACC